jgi:hypothetical protein
MAKRLTPGGIGSRIPLRPGPRQRACLRYESADNHPTLGIAHPADGLAWANNEG